MLFGRLRTPLRLYTDFGTVQKKEVKREFNLFKNENFSTPLIAYLQYPVINKSF